MRYRVAHRSAAARPGLTQVLARMNKVPIILFVLTALGCAHSTAVETANCAALEDWSHVPAHVRSSIVGVVGSVADKGEKFNSTDLVNEGVPNNRFLSGCQLNDLTAVAIERGGRGFHIEVFHIASGDIVRRWTQQVGEDFTATVDLMKPPQAR